VTRGSLLEAPYLRWASARVRQSLGAAGYAFVDDRLFVATLPVAHSFATIYQHRPRYDSWLAQLANQSDWLKSGGALWMHYYFAVHIEMIVAREMGVGIGFLSVMSLRDFNLARRWWHGAICDVRTPRVLQEETGRLAAARMPADGAYGVYDRLLPAGRRRDPRRPTSSTMLPVSARQCPQVFQSGQRVACPSGAPACLVNSAANATARRVREVTERAQRMIRGNEQERSCWTP